MSSYPSSLVVRGDEFLRNGQPHRILSGALHYFRVVPEYWKDRLRKCRAFGLNTIETYVAWNRHEPQKGKFCFDGGLDLARFINLAGTIGLDVILRPGPYICSEWDLGGFPSWLLADPELRLRCMNKRYLDHVASYFDRIIEECGDLQCTKGGPIIAVQLENEYGSYGNDQEYLRWIEAAWKARGIEVLLFTSDGPEDFMLQGGGLPHVLKTVNFGSNPMQAFRNLRRYQPQGPLMCAEFWNGWFDQWGYESPRKEPTIAASILDELLGCGASVNFYMMHGGTNFGLWNGANCLEGYRSVVSSYDYGAPLDEQGNPTEKFRLFREVLKKYGARVGPIPESTPARDFGRALVTGSVDLLGCVQELNPVITSVGIRTMEDIGQRVGWILYRTFVSGPRNGGRLFLEEVHDRALIFLDGKKVAVIHRNDRQDGIALDIPEGGSRLEILVENLGRVNYGHLLHDRKGITESVRWNTQLLFHWQIFSIESIDSTKVPWSAPLADGRPSFYRAEIDIEEPSDSFLRIEAGQRGAVWLNGFALGRYQKEGPQRVLYVPAPLFRKGKNAIVVFDLEPDSVPQPVFGSSSSLAV